MCPCCDVSHTIAGLHTARTSGDGSAISHKHDVQYVSRTGTARSQRRHACHPDGRRTDVSSCSRSALTVTMATSIIAPSQLAVALVLRQVGIPLRAQ